MFMNSVVNAWKQRKSLREKIRKNDFLLCVYGHNPWLGHQTNILEE